MYYNISIESSPSLAVSVASLSVSSAKLITSRSKANSTAVSLDLYCSSHLSVCLQAFSHLLVSMSSNASVVICRTSLILCVMFLDATICLTWLQINSMAFRSGWYGGSRSTSCPYSRTTLSMRYVGSGL